MSTEQPKQINEHFCKKDQKGMSFWSFQILCEKLGIVSTLPWFKQSLCAKTLINPHPYPTMVSITGALSFGAFGHICKLKKLLWTPHIPSNQTHMATIFWLQQHASLNTNFSAGKGILWAPRKESLYEHIYTCRHHTGGTCSIITEVYLKCRQTVLIWLQA